MLAFILTVSGHPGLGLKLGFRHGTVWTLSSGRGDEVLQGSLWGGADRGTPASLPGCLFCVLAPLREYPGCRAGVSRQPVEVLFRKRFRGVSGGVDHAYGTFFLEDRDRQGVGVAGGFLWLGGGGPGRARPG